MPVTSIGEFLLAHSWQWVLLGVLLAAAAFFSAAETALFALSRGELLGLQQDTRRTARLVQSLMRRPNNVLTTVLLGTNIAHILYFVVSSLLGMRVIRAGVPDGRLWALAIFVVTLAAMVLLGEVVPKTVAFLRPRAWAPPAALMLSGLCRLVRPLHRLLMAVFIEPLCRLLAPAADRRGGLTVEEMDALLALSQKRGHIGPGQTELLQEVLQLGDLRARDIMVPRVDVVAYPVDGAPEGLIELIRRRRLTKIPVFERDLDAIVGMVYAKRLLVSPATALRELLAPVQFVPELAPLERVLVQFRATRSQMAVVVDEYGGTAGLITLEDILEEVVGDISDADERPRGPAVRQVARGQWLVDADLPVHEWAEAFPTDLAGARFSTVGGFVISLLGHFPAVGETVRHSNVTFTVEATRPRRISLLRVRLEEAPS